MNFSLLLLTLLIFILFSSAVSKLISINSFRGTILQIGIPKYLSGYISLTIPIIEILIIPLLINNVTLDIGLVAILIMTIVFSGVAVYSMSLGKDIKCNCFGNLTNEKLGLKTFSHIIILVIPTLFLLFNTNINFFSYPIFEILNSFFMIIGIFAIALLVTEMKIFIKSIRLSGFLRRQ